MAKKTSTEIRLQGFWGSDKGGADRAQGEPQESKRRNVYLAALPCEHWEQGAAPKFTDFLWAYAPLQYIRRPVSFGNAAREEHAAAAAWRASWRYERYRHTDCERNGKGDSGSRNRGQIRSVRQNWIRFRERCNLFLRIAAFFFCGSLAKPGIAP